MPQGLRPDSPSRCVGEVVARCVRIWRSLGPRLVEMHRILTQKGSLYLHCDPTASHYLKGVMDRYFRGREFQERDRLATHECT